MPATVATLNRNGGRPAVEIIIGNAQPATYEFSLFDSNGGNRQEFANGRTDTIPDIFTIPGPTVAALDRTTIMWRAVVDSVTGAADDTFTVTVRVIQDGRVAGSETRTGLITDTPPEGFIRLQLG
jgi:hypothetical protein